MSLLLNFLMGVQPWRLSSIFSTFKILKQVVYDNIPHHCSYCHHLGHNFEVCKRRVERVQGSERQGKDKEMVKQIQGSEWQEKDKGIGSNVGVSYRKIQGGKVQDPGGGLNCVPTETVHTRIRTGLKDQDMKFAAISETAAADSPGQPTDAAGIADGMVLNEGYASGLRLLVGDVNVGVNPEVDAGAEPVTGAFTAAVTSTEGEAMTDVHAGADLVATRNRFAGLSEEVLIEDVTLEEGEIAGKDVGATDDEGAVAVKHAPDVGTATENLFAALSDGGSTAGDGYAEGSAGYAEGSAGYAAGVAGNIPGEHVAGAAAGESVTAGEYVAEISGWVPAAREGAGLLGAAAGLHLGKYCSIRGTQHIGPAGNEAQVERVKGIQQLGGMLITTLVEAAKDTGNEANTRPENETILQQNKSMNRGVGTHGLPTEAETNLNTKCSNSHTASITPRKLSSAAAEFTPKWAVLVEELVEDKKQSNTVLVEEEVDAGSIEEKSATAGGQVVRITNNDMEQLKERLNRLRGNSFPAAPSLAASTWAPLNMSKHLAREFKKARKQYRSNQNWQDIEDYSDEESDEGDIEEKAGSQMMNGNAFLTDEMGDIPRPFKIKSAPNSPKGRNSSYDSSTYLLSRGLF